MTVCFINFSRHSIIVDRAHGTGLIILTQNNSQQSDTDVNLEITTVFSINATSQFKHLPMGWKWQTQFNQCNRTVLTSTRAMSNVQVTKTVFSSDSQITRIVYLNQNKILTWELFLNIQTHTHTRLTALCPGLPESAGTRKEKPIWILLNQETVSDSGISRAICKSAPCAIQCQHPTTQFLQAGCPSYRLSKNRYPYYTQPNPWNAVFIHVAANKSGFVGYT